MNSSDPRLWEKGKAYGLSVSCVLWRLRGVGYKRLQMYDNCKHFALISPTKVYIVEQRIGPMFTDSFARGTLLCIGRYIYTVVVLFATRTIKKFLEIQKQIDSKLTYFHCAVSLAVHRNDAASLHHHGVRVEGRPPDEDTRHGKDRRKAGWNLVRSSRRGDGLLPHPRRRPSRSKV